MGVIYQWLDVVWIPIALFIGTKELRLFAVGFSAGCIIMMCMQIHQIHEIGFDRGFTNLITADAYNREMDDYGV